MVMTRVDHVVVYSNLVEVCSDCGGVGCSVDIHIVDVCDGSLDSIVEGSYCVSCLRASGHSVEVTTFVAK